ncbi:MAG: hypothetical protein HN348_11405 [Proteobacteria bacterium]|nr:hypothetical protein [Pseudomonadota bacterium]
MGRYRQRNRTCSCCIASALLPVVIVAPLLFTFGSTIFALVMSVNQAVQTNEPTAIEQYDPPLSGVLLWDTVIPKKFGWVRANGCSTRD